MSLAAVVRLVVEKMVERGREHLLDILRVDDGAKRIVLARSSVAQSRRCNGGCVHLQRGAPRAAV